MRKYSACDICSLQRTAIFPSFTTCAPRRCGQIWLNSGHNPVKFEQENEDTGNSVLNSMLCIVLVPVLLSSMLALKCQRFLPSDLKGLFCVRAAFCQLKKVIIAV